MGASVLKGVKCSYVELSCSNPCRLTCFFFCLCMDKVLRVVCPPKIVRYTPISVIQVTESLKHLVEM